MWLSLERHFGKLRTYEIDHLMRALFAVTQDSLSITEYYVKVQDLWQEIDSLLPSPHCRKCGEEGAFNCELNLTRLTPFLARLNETYVTTRNFILLMEPPPTLDQVYAMLLDVENQLYKGAELSGSA
ncbi:uncharacterized protein LOC141818598 [Curcuma longa]|uniref:uncharacterized protein LOC141818598 n=1 Tax=Curcuma longa TaxID=136217 RepID=UPI003D9F4796